MKNNFPIIVATGFYSGYLRPYSGTWGTIPAWLIGFYLINNNQFILITVAILSIIISVWSATEAEKKFGHDSKNIVIDEWAGMFVTFILLPFSLLNYIIAFVVFRASDVIKIPPAAQFERLPKGWGVTMDDVMAGIYANIITRFIILGIERYFPDLI